LSKIYVRLFLKYIKALEDKSGILLAGNHQHGFIRNRSTTKACLTIPAKLAEKLESGETILLYSTNLSAAFDMLNPKLLSERLTNLGLPKMLRLILEDYVRDRIAYIDINGSTSNVFDIILGCVQGTVLVPIIFSIFMRPLETINNDITSYADDTYGLIKLHELHDTMTPTGKISKHMNWLKKSGMIANENKTEIMILHKTKRLEKD